MSSSIINSDIFPKLKSIKLNTRQDGDGNEIQVEVREDEEQSVKLQEIIDILVAAGYFRARIKGLSSFDKVVGGMTWCIESCNIDVDVDLLFQENLTIGQKIALTEKIVAVLQKMKCPHRIEPHQIQGLDFIHIFPVIQWLVKTSMEFRQEMSAFVKSYALNQFNKTFHQQQEKTDLDIKNNIKTVQDVYRPKRYYRRKNAPPDNYETKIQITILEYGNKNNKSAANTNNKDLSAEVIENQKEEFLHIEKLMQGLTITSLEDSKEDVLNEEQKEELLRHYQSLQAEIKDGGVMSQKEKQINILQKQKTMLEQQLMKLSEEKTNADQEINDVDHDLNEINSKINDVNKALSDLDIKEAADPETIKKVEELVLIHESLKDQEQKFREHCKSELVKLQKLIEEAQTVKVPESNKTKMNDEVDVEKEKLKTLRLQIAKKCRAIAGLERQLDEVPTRAELAQYQRRFLELYNQVSAKHKETKQYYTLYNTLDDTRLYIRKELTLLNSILDNYPEAMQSQGGKEEFIKQFESIVENVKQTKIKLKNKCLEEKKVRDEMSQRLLTLVELQRKYVSAVRQLDIECRKNELILLQKSQ